MSAADDRNREAENELLAWRWREDRNPTPSAKIPGAGTIQARRADGGILIERLDAPDQTRWEFPVPDADAASIDADAHAAYAAVYRTGATGARLRALDAESGDVLWDVALDGLGLFHHSKYANAVELRLVDRAVVVYGLESNGRYVEARATNDGSLLGHRVLPRG